MYVQPMVIPAEVWLKDLFSFSSVSTFSSEYLFSHLWEDEQPNISQPPTCNGTSYSLYTELSTVRVVFPSLSTHVFERATRSGSNYISPRPQGGEVAILLGGVLTRPEVVGSTITTMDTMLPLPQESLQ